MDERLSRDDSKDYCIASSLVHWFLEWGPNLEARNNDNSTALCYFSSLGDLRVVKRLLRLRVNLDVKGRKECTPLMEASKAGHATVVEVLLQEGADVNYVNGLQQT